MRQKLVLESPFVDHLSVEEEDEFDRMEDRDEEAPWELAFERGVELADTEMVNEWDEEDEFV